MSQFILEISKLSVAERIQLVQEILKTISDETGQSSDIELSEAQKKEIERRSESIKSGEAKTVSWDSIAEKLKQRMNYKLELHEAAEEELWGTVGNY